MGKMNSFYTWLEELFEIGLEQGVFDEGSKIDYVNEEIVLEDNVRMSVYNFLDFFEGDKDPNEVIAEVF